MNRFALILCLLIIFAVPGCKQEQQTPAALSSAEAITLTDVEYGHNSLQKMDVYLPKNRDANTRVIIFVHGGGWYSGDKSEGKDGATYFQQQGYVFISINYRLTRTAENNIHPAQIQDIQLALDFISQKNMEWNISDNKIVFFGGSAGAHLSLLFAYKYDIAKKIKAVISVAGPTDLTDSSINANGFENLTVQDLIESFIGKTITADLKAWQDASPINSITAASAPTFFIHGTNDHTVPYQQSVSAYEKLQALGVTTQLETLSGVDHDLVGINWLDVLPKIQNFVNTNTP